jgi:hypothetical protein
MKTIMHEMSLYWIFQAIDYVINSTSACKPVPHTIQTHSKKWSLFQKQTKYCTIQGKILREEKVNHIGHECLFDLIESVVHDLALKMKNVYVGTLTSALLPFVQPL